MTTLLKQTIPGTPGFPGTAARPAFTVSSVSYQPQYTTQLVQKDGATYIFQTGGQVIPVVTYTTYPAVNGTPPVAGKPFSYNYGWNAGARSANSMVGGGGYQFSVPRNVVGLIVGLKTGAAAYLFNEVEHGLYFHNGIVEVVERGVTKNTLGGYATTDLFKIIRSDGVVRYIKNGIVVYTSTVPSVGTAFLDTSIYGGVP